MIDVLLLGARTTTDLALKARRLGELSDVAAMKRESESDLYLPCRAAVVFQDEYELHKRLEVVEQMQADIGVFIGRAANKPRIGFLFPGQGVQRVGMGSQLAKQDACFGEELVRFVGQVEGLDEIIAGNVAGLDDTRWAQPAIVATELALIRRLAELGVRPDIVLGHSLGEVSAAVAAGVLSEANALRGVVSRAALMADTDGYGGMMVVLGNAEGIEKILKGVGNEVGIAAFNAPGVVTISGHRDQVSQAGDALEEAGWVVRPLNVSVAPHSSRMTAFAEKFDPAAVGLQTGRVCVPLISAMRGRVIPAGALIPAQYWIDHIVQPVRFVDAVRVAVAVGIDLFVEVGPGDSLIGLVRRCLGTSAPVAFISSLLSKEEGSSLATLAAFLFCAGVEIKWNGC